jgi:cathepsin C
VKHYKYIGGVYGKSTERKIMEEIHEHGPVVMNFEPEFDIMFYGGGIYHSVQAADWIMKKEERSEWVLEIY